MFHKIANISIGGIGIFPQSSFNPKNKELSIQLYIDVVKFDVRIEVVHEDDGIAGCRFIDPDPKLIAAIENYFEIELAALKMSRVESQDEDILRGKSIFLIGKNNCEIHVQEIDEVLQHFSIILFGNYVEGAKTGKIWVGEKIDSSENSAPEGVKLFKPVKKATQHLIESAKRFIKSAQGLSEKQKDDIGALLAKSNVETTSSGK